MENLAALDASVLVEYFRSKNKGETLFGSLLQQRSTLYVPAVAKYEVVCGARDEDMEFWRTTLFGIDVLPVDDLVVGKAREVYRQLRASSCLLEAGDILIAATAMVNDLPLATLNRRHFEQISGLELIF